MPENETGMDEYHDSIKKAGDAAIKSITEARVDAIKGITEAKRIAFGQGLGSSLLIRAAVLLLALGFGYMKLVNKVTAINPTTWKQVALAVVPQIIFGLVCVVFLVTSRNDDT